MIEQHSYSLRMRTTLRNHSLIAKKYIGSLLKLYNLRYAAALRPALCLVDGDERCCRVQFFQSLEILNAYSVYDL
jgi:hypothetical protein